MCGICGLAYVDSSRRAGQNRLIAMRDSIAHRGPDGVGSYTHGPVGLAHRRLSIIDVEGGKQPLCNEDGTIWISFNGEIYNYAELTADLAGRGHRFRTHCDTETLVHAYEEYGLGFVERLNGMFALAIHDQRRRRVVLARDHFGIKPLFYSVTKEGLFFASEIKAVLAGSGEAAAPREESLAEYMIFRYTAGSRTFFSGVEKLPPAHIAVWDGRALSTRRYWSLPDPQEPRVDDAEVIVRLDELLGKSVQSQLMSEVPLGSFCSGGVDSGLVTAYAARHKGVGTKTFSVGFEDSAFDETALARNTATRYGTDHHVIVARPSDVGAVLPLLLRYQDEPLSHPNSAPLYMLSRIAREHVTVVLTGEGSDELFAGYPRYQIARLSAALRGLSPFAARAASRLLSSFPGRRTSLLSWQLPLSEVESMVLNSAYVRPDVVEALLGGLPAATFGERFALAETTRIPGNSIASLSRYEMSTYLGCALDRMDRMSMAHGLEGRVPFLDVPLVEWAGRLDVRHKVRGRRAKRVVKALAARMLSGEIVNARKSGFGLPLASWFRDPHFAGLLERLHDPRHPAAEHFDRRVVRSVLQEHLHGHVDHGELLWLLSNVYLWYEEIASPTRRQTTRHAQELDAVST